MGLFNNISAMGGMDDNLLAALARGFGLGPARPKEPPPAPGDAQRDVKRTPEQQHMFDTIAERIKEVRAVDRGRDAQGNAIIPTLEDVREACERFGKKTLEGQAMVARGEWGPKIYARLNGQDLSGFGISEPKKVRKQQTEKAVVPSEKSGAAKAMTNLMDLDSDGAISDFYDEISLIDADLSNAYVDPATSYNDEIAKAGSTRDDIFKPRCMTGMVFNGMQEGDKFRFPRGEHEDIKLTGVNGGKITFSDQSHVHGLTIEGKQAKISIGDYASVDDLSVSHGFSILKLKMGKNAELSNADLTHSTIAMNSEFERGATLREVKLGDNIKGLDFGGVNLVNVTIKGEPVTRVEQLQAAGVEVDSTTNISATDEFIKCCALKNARSQSVAEGAKLLNTMRNIGAQTPPPTIAATRAAPDPENSMPKTRIAFDGNASFGDYSYNLGKDLVGRTQPEPSMGMSMPGAVKS